MPEPLACLDAAYADNAAGAACALFAHWDVAAPLRVLTTRQAQAPPYEPGAFYKRELPLLLAVLDQLEQLPRLLIIDGYVWLDSDHRPGLGAMLHRALGERATVVGVAKTRFGSESACASMSVPVVRGASQRALYVSAVGMDATEAARWVQGMAGEHRIPIMLGLVDSAARHAIKPGPDRAPPST